MKITLVQPPLTLKERYGIKSKSGGESVPLGLAYLAASARAARHQVSVIDAEILDLDLTLTVEKILAADPAVVGFTAVTISVGNAAAVASEIKKIKPEIITLIGGHHLSTRPAETMGLYPQFDLGVIGEGEMTLVELLAVLSEFGFDKDRLRQVNGLIYKSDSADDFIVTLPRQRIIDLDILPPPAFDLLPDLLKYSPPVHTVKKFPAATLVTSRGCPGQCVFCTRSVYGNILSAHSAEYMIELILLLYHKYGIREIQIRDDNFTAFKPRLYKFCRLLKEQKLDLVWTALARVDMVEPEMLIAMKEAGCWQVWYGVESGNEDILKLIKKNTTKEQIRNAIDWTKRAGIDVGAFFMMGHPGETKETMQETIDFALSLPIDEFHCSITTPFPGSELSRNYAQYGTFETDWKEMNGWRPVFVPFGLTEGEIKKYNQLFFRKFYFRPRIILNYLKRLRSPRQAWAYFLGFVALWEWIFVKDKHYQNMNILSKMKKIYSAYKPWFLILSAFIAMRIAFLIAFWQEHLPQGIWRTFYNHVDNYDYAEQIPSFIALAFHEICDWHPPLYYFICSLIVYVTHGPWFIYAIQMILAVLVLFISYKIIKLFFSATTALIAVFLLAINPYWAWSNWLFFSENLSTPLFLGVCYYFLRFIKEERIDFFYYSAVGLGLITLTRLNFVFLPLLFVIFIFLFYFFKKSLKLGVLPTLSLKKLLVSSVIFLTIFAALLIPWLIRNKIVYDRFTLANVLSTNTYFYNVPTLMSIKEGIPYSVALQYLTDKAYADLGKNVGDKSDCRVYTKDQLNRQFDYYQTEARKYLLANFWLYAKIHMVRTLPFFLQSGNLDIYSAYTGAAPKVDLSGALLSGNFGAIKAYFTNFNVELALYVAGLLFCILSTLALLFSLIYAYFKDRQKFVVFFIIWAILIYNAFLISPFANVRYRLPVYIFFFLALAYCYDLLLSHLKNNKHLIGDVIKKIPLISSVVKIIYDWRREKNTSARISDFMKLEELPFAKEAPAAYEIGLEPTIRCNLRCKMCYQGENRNLRQAELSSEEIFNVFKKIAPQTKEIKLVGGEPFARQDILELIAFWDSIGKRVILQTNCTMIDENNIERLKEYKNLTDILTSLDGPREMHDLIRGVPGSFDRLERAVDLIKNNMPQVPITIFATLLINDNLDDFFALIDVTRKLGITTVNVLFEQVYSAKDVANSKEIFQKEFGWEEGRDYRLNTQTRDPIFPAGISPSELKKKMYRIRSYGFKRGCYVNFTPFNYYNNLPAYLGQKPLKPFCLKLLSPELRINQRGEVVWCDIIEKSFGSLLEKTPDEIWLSDEYQKFRRYLSKNYLPICSRCCKASYLKNNQIISRNNINIDSAKLFILITLFALANLVLVRVFFNFSMVTSDSLSYADAAYFIQFGNWNGGLVTYSRLLLTPLMLVCSNFFGYLTGSFYGGMLVVNVFFYFLIVLVFGDLVNLIYQNKKVAFLGALLLIGNFCLYSMGVNYGSDIGGWFFLILSSNLSLRYYYGTRDRGRYFYLAIIAAVIGILFKETGGLGIVVLLAIIAIKKIDWRLKARNICLATIGFIAPILIYHLWFYFNFNYSYFDWYIICYQTYSSSSAHTLSALVKILFWLFNFGWLFFVAGVYQEIKIFNRERILILLALLTGSLIFLVWPYFAPRIGFILVPWFALIASHGLKKIPNRLIIILMLLYFIINYLVAVKFALNLNLLHYLI